MKSWMKAAAAGAAVALLAACGTDRAAEPVMPQESAAKTEAANAEVCREEGADRVFHVGGKYACR